MTSKCSPNNFLKKKTNGKSIVRLSFNRWLSRKFLPCRLTPTFQTLNGGNKPAGVILKDCTTKPEKCFGRTVLVRHGDSNWRYQTNQATYFDYCMDAATEGTKLGHFRLLNGDLLSKKVEFKECSYYGRSTPGDELKVYVWENPAKASELLCQIKKDEEVIWVGKVGFRLNISSKI